MMKSYKNILIYLSVGIILIVSIFFAFNKKEEYKELPKVKLKEQLNNKQFALMLEQENGKYEESTGELPTEGYVFNQEKSGCTDINGKIIDGALNYDYETYTVLVDTSKTSYCYLYYDIEPNISNLRKNDPGNYLSKNLQGGMYRYQGLYTDDIKNYICLGEYCCKTMECPADDNDDMYRIIGINAKGELKVIKKTSLTNRVNWWNDFVTNIKWPQSLVYQKLNGKSVDGTTNPNYNDTNSYYYSLDANVKSKIVNNHSWLYGDAYDFNDFDYNGDTIYGIESGKNEATYYQEGDSNGSPIGKGEWSDRIEAPLGLIYISDYYYAYKTSEKDAGNPLYSSNAVNSWIHLSHNETTHPIGSNGYEGTMSRYGFYAVSSRYLAWDVRGNGLVDCDFLDYGFALRPVLFLSSSIGLSGEGTLSNPFKIDY